MNNPLPQNVSHFYDPMAISWRVAQASSCSDPQLPCVGVGSSSNPVYVTFGRSVLPPTMGNTPNPMALTYAALAVGGADATSAAEVFRNVWSKFSISGGPANLKAWDGWPLYYYPQGVGFDSCALTPYALLTTRINNGQCGSFAYLLEDVLSAGGIPVQGSPLGTPLTSFTSVCPTDSIFGQMLVQNWGFAPSPTYNPAQTLYPYALTVSPYIPGSSDTMVPPPGGPGTVAYGDLTNLPGIPGQNSQGTWIPASAPSEKIFGSHYILKLEDPSLGALAEGSGVYFDPSYGKRYNDRAAFESGLAGYAVHDQNYPPADTTRWVARQKGGPVGVKM